MRWPTLAVLIAMDAGSAVAGPKFREELERMDPVLCERAKTWKVIEKCLGKHGTVTLVYEADGVKVASVAEARLTGTSSRIALYSQQPSGWIRSGLNATSTATTEILSVAAFPTSVGAGVRVDLGTSMRSSFSIDAVTSTRGVFRRIHTTVCLPPQWACRTVISACDAYVRGKVFWTFRAEVLWDVARGVRLRGDLSHAGGACMPSQSSIDPIEGE